MSAVSGGVGQAATGYLGERERDIDVLSGLDHEVGEVVAATGLVGL